MSYQITILSDEDFEKLPYEEASVSLGLADTKTNKAYVRHVANDDLQKYLVNHELEHLIGEDRDEVHHGGNGVYYKGFGNVFSGMGQAIGGMGQSIGGALGNIGGAAQGFGQNIGQGIGNMFGSLGNAMGFGGGFQGGANPRGGLAASAAANPALRAPTGYYGGLASMGANMPGFRAPAMGLSQIGQMMQTGQGSGYGTAGYTPRSTQGMGMESPSVGGQKMTTPSMPISAQVSQGLQSPQVQSQGSQQQKPGGGLLGNISGLLDLGGQAMSMFKGSSGFGAQAGGPMGSRLPDMSQLPSVQEFKNYDFRGNLANMDPALQDAINRDFDRIDAQEEHEFRNMWKNIRPGADLESDSVFARDYNEMKRAQGVRRADQLAKYRFEMLETNFGINKVEAERLQDLAQLDVDTISFNTGLDAMEAMSLKQMFGYGTSEESNVGGMLGQASNLVGQVGNLASSFRG